MFSKRFPHERQTTCDDFFKRNGEGESKATVPLFHNLVNSTSTRVQTQSLYSHNHSTIGYSTLYCFRNEANAGRWVLTIFSPHISQTDAPVKSVTNEFYRHSQRPLKVLPQKNDFITSNKSNEIKRFLNKLLQVK